MSVAVRKGGCIRASTETDTAALGWQRRVRVSPDAGLGGACEHRLVGPRVLIVDDHAPFRAVARAMLAAGGFDVVGDVATGAAALLAAAALKPDLVLLDVQLPDTDGFVVSRALRRSAVGGRPVRGALLDS